MLIATLTLILSALDTIGYQLVTFNSQNPDNGQCTLSLTSKVTPAPVVDSAVAQKAVIDALNAVNYEIVSYSLGTNGMYPMASPTGVYSVTITPKPAV